MRTLANPSDLTADVIKYNFTATIHKNRRYYSRDDLVLPIISFPEIDESCGISTEPLQQDYAYDFRDAETDTIIGAIAYGGCVRVSREGGIPRLVTFGGNPLSIDDNCRPTVRVGDSNLEIYYSSETIIKRATIDRTLLKNNVNACVTSVESIYEVGHYASVHFVAGTDYLAILYLDEGGIRAALYDVALSEVYISPWRLMIPEKIYDESNGEDIAFLGFSDAISANGRIFIYQSNYFGGVSVIEYVNGQWTGWEEAIRVDLGNYRIGSAYTLPNPFTGLDDIHLVGQFQRIDPLESFSSSIVHNFDNISRNPNSSTYGRSFSIDQSVSIGYGDTEADADTQLGMRLFGIVGANGYPVYGTSNRWLPENKSYSITTDETGDDCLVIPASDLLVPTGNPHGEISVVLADMYGTYAQSEYLKQGNILSIRVEINEEEVFEQEESAVQIPPWFVGIISGLTMTNGEDIAEISITAMTLGIYCLMNMNNPMYVELQSNQQGVADLENLSNVYLLSDDEGFDAPLMVEVIGNNTSDQQNNFGDYKDWITEDLVDKNIFMKYPKVRELPFVMDIYGWSRSGGKCQVGETTDIPLNPAAPNDNISGLLYVKHEDGTEELIECAEPVSKSYFPQTWYTGEHGRGDGEYPVQVNARAEDGLVVGDTILKIGARATNNEETSEALGLRVLSAADDGFGNATPEFTRSGGSMRAGKNHYGYSHKMYCRFTVPYGNAEVINSAYLSFSVFSKIVSGTHLRIYAEAVDDATVPGSWADLNGRPLSTAYVDWDPPEYTSGGATVITPDITAVIQEIVNRPGWILDNQINIIVVDNGSAASCEAILTTFEHSTRIPPTLYVAVSSDQTSHYLERVEIPSLHGRVFHKGALVDFVDLPNGIDTTTRALKARRAKTYGKWGLYVMTEPFFADAWDMSIEGIAAMGWLGLAGFIVDNDNFIAARYGCSNGAVVGTPDTKKLQLIKVVDGYETILEELDTEARQDSISMRFRYFQGTFFIWINSGLRADGEPIEWGEPDIEYEWQEDDGILSSSNDIAHVGAYFFMETRWAITGGFYASGRNLDDTSESYKVYDVSLLLHNIEGPEITFVFDYEDKAYSSELRGWELPTIYRKGPYRLLGWDKDIGINPTPGGHDYGYRTDQLPISMFEYLSNNDFFEKYAGHYLSGYANIDIRPDDENTGEPLLPLLIAASNFTVVKSGTTMTDRSSHGPDPAILNQQYITSYLENAEKLWITQGLGAVGVIYGDNAAEAIKAPYGALIFECGSPPNTTGNPDAFEKKITFWDFHASSARNDYTVKTLLENFTALSGTQCSFPGDLQGEGEVSSGNENEELGITPSFSVVYVSPTGAIYRAPDGAIYGIQGTEMSNPNLYISRGIEFVSEITGLEPSNEYVFESNIIVYENDPNDPDPSYDPNDPTDPNRPNGENWFSKVVLGIAEDSSMYIEIRRGDDTNLTRLQLGEKPDVVQLRVVCKEDYIDVFIGRVHVLSYHPEYMHWLDDIRYLAYINGDCVANHIWTISELPDSRDAVFIDLESTGNTAIESVIQQRPVRTVPHISGLRGSEVEFYYWKIDQDEYQLSKQERVVYTSRPDAQSASDAIVYSYTVKIVEDTRYLEDRGFRTVLYRLPDLEAGYASAAEVILNRARKMFEWYNTTCRFNPAIEQGDNALIDITTQAGRNIAKNIKVEQVVLGNTLSMEIAGYDTSA